jgi:hypothetical protein
MPVGLFAWKSQNCQVHEFGDCPFLQRSWSLFPGGSEQAAPFFDLYTDMHLSTRLFDQVSLIQKPYYVGMK